MVVMDPNEVSVLNDLFQSISKRIVSFLIRFPEILVKVDFARMIVKQGPDNGRVS
jgi:hypothetical protein